MKILFACPYPTGRVASQRFRFEQYFPLLTKNNISYETAPFGLSHFDSANDRSMSDPSTSVLSKVKWVLNGIWSRVKLFSRLNQFDFIFIHRELAPVGPPVFEWLIARVYKKRIIYDFDDAIWLTDRTTESTIEKILRCRSKVALICRWSHRVSCGNRYLRDYAIKFNPETFINPTTIETTRQHNPEVKEARGNGNVTIGWTGSHSTLKYLKTLVPVLQSLEQKYPHVKFLIIADEDPKLPLKQVAFLRWNLETEIADLASIDIGIMPLPDDSWTRGKGGFKALQYLAMEIPAVVSPVGINTEIVTHGQDGFLCTTDHEWFTHLEKLVLHRSLRTEMGRRGRQKVIAHYSEASNAENFLSLFQ